MSIIRQPRQCGACGKTFKVDSRSTAKDCWDCHLATVEADYLEHARRMAAMPVPAWAEGDPFLNLWGQELSVGLAHTGKDPFRAVKP